MEISIPKADCYHRLTINGEPNPSSPSPSIYFENGRTSKHKRLLHVAHLTGRRSCDVQTTNHDVTRTYRDYNIMYDRFACVRCIIRFAILLLTVKLYAQSRPSSKKCAFATRKTDNQKRTRSSCVLIAFTRVPWMHTVYRI